MALADIISKIDGDARGEAGTIILAAEERAAGIISRAEASATELRESSLETAQRDAEREAARVLVSAKLAARDEALAGRREMIDEIMRTAANEIASARDGDYASFIVRKIAAVARGGEVLHVGSADASRSGAIAEALRMLAPGLKVELSEEPAPFERGALLTAERARVDLSLEAMLEERRDELEVLVAGILFEPEVGA